MISARLPTRLCTSCGCVAEASRRRDSGCGTLRLARRRRLEARESDAVRRAAGRSLAIMAPILLGQAQIEPTAHHHQSGQQAADPIAPIALRAACGEDPR